MVTVILNKNQMEDQEMKPIYVAIILITALVAVNTFSSVAQTPEQLYQRGLLKEEGEGALQEAIDLFNQVAENEKALQPVRAKALLHIGMCYEKLGNQEAVKAYNKLINNFPAQNNEVAIARERLSSLTKTEKPGEVSIRQVWAGQAADDFGSVSADGGLLSFTDWENGNLAVRNLKTGENRQVSNDATWIDSVQYAEYSRISPDGKQFAVTWYYKNLNYQLRLYKSDSQKPIILYSCKGWNEYITPGVWFADGKRIIAQKSDNITRTIQLIIINTSSGKTELVKETSAGLSFMSNLSLSPDEKYLAFDLPDPSNNGMFDISVISLDTKQETLIVGHPSNDRLVGWLPGRNEILFVSDRSGAKDIWALTVSDGKSAGVPKRILKNTGTVNPMGFTRNGSLVFGVSTTEFESFIIPLDSKTGKVAMNERTPLSGQLFGCTWMPDGESLLFTEFIQTQASRTRINMSMVNLTTGKSRILAESLNIAGYFRLSPDMKSAAAFGRDQQRLDEKNYSGALYLIDIESGGMTEVKTSHDVSRAFSCEYDKEGKNIFYFSKNDLVKHNLDTKHEEVIYSAKGVNNPLVTRLYDGNHLMFDAISNLNNNMFHLLSVPVTGGDADTLATYQGIGNPRLKRMALSPDGKFIYLSTRASGMKSVLSRIPSAGGTPENLWQSSYYFIAGISIHPKGNQIALSTFETAREIRIIENLDKKVTELFQEKK